MDVDSQIRSAVANINDELQRILAVTEVGNLPFEEFRKQLIDEFNKKLRGLKEKVKDLTAENKQLKKKIAYYESGNILKARPTKSEGGIPNLQFVSPTKRKKRKTSEDEQVTILSSPVKPASQEIGSDMSKNDLTSSQFNRLPTQYSDSELPRKLPRKGELTDLPVKDTFVGSEERIVADSEDEFGTLDDQEVGFPKHYTALQRVSFLRKYYQTKLNDLKFCVKLAQNPITEKPWAQDDFKPNGSWRRPNRGEGRAMTKAQESNLKSFFDIAGKGAPSGGPVWDDEQHVEEEPTRSQIMDKYLSPPGYMLGSFPNTQEQEERKQEVKRRAEDRIRRRLASALAKPPGEFIFYEDVLNQYVARGQYKA